MKTTLKITTFVVISTDHENKQDACDCFGDNSDYNFSLTDIDDEECVIQTEITEVEIIS